MSEFCGFHGEVDWRASVSLPPQFEILLCVQDHDDPAIDVCKKLLGKYPSVDARLFIGKRCLRSSFTCAVCLLLLLFITFLNTPVTSRLPEDVPPLVQRSGKRPGQLGRFPACALSTAMCLYTPETGNWFSLIKDRKRLRGSSGPVILLSRVLITNRGHSGPG